MLLPPAISYVRTTSRNALSSRTVIATRTEVIKTKSFLAAWPILVCGDSLGVRDSMRIPRLLLLLLTAFFAGSTTANDCFAQSEPTDATLGSVFGAVQLSVDESSSSGAQLTFHNESSGWVTATAADDHGKFDIAGLPRGLYRVTVTAPLCNQLQVMVNVQRRTGPVLLEVTRTVNAATPVNDYVVSVHELLMSGKGLKLFEKGTKLLQRGNAHDSVPYFERALAKDPGSYRAYQNLGLAEYQLGDKDKAEEALQRAIELTGGGYAPAQFALAMILFEKGRFRQAEGLIQRGLAAQPGSSTGKYFLAEVQFALNRLPDAEVNARAALQQDPKQADAHILLAEIHERSHNPYAVQKDIAAYLKLAPGGAREEEANLLFERAQSEISQTAGSSR